jgi:hypothetical protein
MSARFRILLLEENSEGLRAEALFSTDDQAKIERLRALAAGLGTSSPVLSSRPGPKGRQVIILGKAEDSESPVQIGDLFDTAMAASIAIGFPGYNAVSQALNKAHNSGEDRAELRGVEFGYADEQGRV